MKILAWILGVVCRVVWAFLGSRSPIAWLTENFHEERNHVETEPSEYYDAVESGESTTPEIWAISHPEVRPRVKLELSQQLRELRESLLAEREAGLIE